ncbi:hypothetical protein IQ241_19350 [Romeria aff. gracilis LEGE 07310]|uniref:Uncharacterized protein n=1 Tax=Vasconcelosia minhoensis LEGE 07310 TaxID=915328 RepID=A0A8J7A8X4_9CYAN|nr:hypothetical protein [Romeria gracilis]MBE9079427.1 hypothetical protein [Romeria aff. gracilis LEGE 07310]
MLTMSIMVKVMVNLTNKAKFPLLLGFGLIGVPAALLVTMMGLAALKRQRVPASEVSKVGNVQVEQVTADISVQPGQPMDQTFRDAVNTAMEAATAAQIASTRDAWNYVGELWNKAIALMQAVPEADENYQIAQVKAVEYQKNLDYAQARSQALMPSIGASKAEVRATFGQTDVDFTFQDAPANDGPPRLVGKSPNGIALMELYGAGDALNKATMATTLGTQMPEEYVDLAAIYNVAFLAKTAPSYDWDAWFGKSVQELAAAGSGEKRVNVGDNGILLTFESHSGQYKFFLSVEPE